MSKWTGTGNHQRNLWSACKVESDFQVMMSGRNFRLAEKEEEKKKIGFRSNAIDCQWSGSAGSDCRSQKLDAEIKYGRVINKKKKKKRGQSARHAGQAKRWKCLRKKIDLTESKLIFKPCYHKCKSRSRKTMRRTNDNWRMKTLWKNADSRQVINIFDPINEFKKLRNQIK